MLLRRGQVAAEAWWAPYGPDIPHMMFSLSKSFTSTAIGLAVSEGSLTVEDAVVSFFPERAVPDANLSKMKVKHLLSMSTGHAKDTTGALREREDGDWVQAFLEPPVEHEPGTHFVYNNGATYMLSAIVQTLSGQKLHDYLQPRLFEPLGIRGSAWDTCPRGINTGGWGLNLKTEDIARFGQLYVQEGVWNGVRSLPEAWIREATAFQVSNGDGGDSDWKQGYGYQFWRCRHGAYRGDGAFGQFCVVLPEQEAVIAMTAGTGDMQAVLNAVWEFLLPALSDAPLPENEGEQAKLKEKLASLAYPPLGSGIVPPAAERVSGRRYLLEDNARNVRAVELRFGESDCILKLWYGEEEAELLCGIGRRTEGEIRHIHPSSRILASGKWEGPEKFVMEWRFVETPFTHTLTFDFEEERLNLRMEANVGWSTEPLVLQGRQE
ncbi:beta-lactamase family protein [Paenibacillus sp. P25]|nr:beta-lactamase family protein [Paenibacillus sp. P25]